MPMKDGTGRTKCEEVPLGGGRDFAEGCVRLHVWGRLERLRCQTGETRVEEGTDRAQGKMPSGGIYGTGRAHKMENKTNRKSGHGMKGLRTNSIQDSGWAGLGSTCGAGERPMAQG